MATEIKKRLTVLSGSLFIGNQWVASVGAKSDVTNPATEEVIGHFAHATPTEMDEAISRAAHAQKTWWAMSALDRATALHQVADRMASHSSATGESLTREMGKPYREANWEGGAAASSFRYYAEIARSEQVKLHTSQ
jgi:betaine-aldehyde dehydrogenase